MDRCAEHETVSFGGNCREIVHSVFPEASVRTFLAARSAADASGERFRAYPEDAALHALRGEFFCDLVEGGASAAVFVRRTVYKQYLHDPEPFVWNIVFDARIIP